MCCPLGLRCAPNVEPVMCHRPLSVTSHGWADLCIRNHLLAEQKRREPTISKPAVFWGLPWGLVLDASSFLPLCRMTPGKTSFWSGTQAGSLGWGSLAHLDRTPHPTGSRGLTRAPLHVSSLESLSVRAHFQPPALPATRLTGRACWLPAGTGSWVLGTAHSARERR